MRLRVAFAWMVACSTPSGPPATPPPVTETVEVALPVASANSSAASLEPLPRPSAAVAAEIPKEEPIGVAECDAYLDQLRTCIRKTPEAAEAMSDAMMVTRKAWRDAARQPEARAALASGCRAALDALAANPVCQP